MALDIKLNQKMQQTLVMTPQLQHALKLLQMGRMDFLEAIDAEVLSNPLLEVEIEAEAPMHLLSGGLEQVEGVGEEQATPEELKTAPRERELEQTEGDWSTLLEQGEHFDYRHRSREVGIDGTNSWETIATGPEGLSSHLLWQLRMSEIGTKELDVAVQIIGNLDRNGYLSCSVEEIAELCAASVELVLEVLAVVQSLEPVGIAARDLRECLLIQLEHRGQINSLAWTIADRYLQVLENNNYSLIQREQGVDSAQIQAAVAEIRQLEPRPGRAFVDELPLFVTPDVYVRKIGESIKVTLNENGMPKLKLNKVYQEILAQGAAPTGSDKSYLQEKFKSASWLLRSIEQRGQTICRVTESIMNFQKDFLDKGVSALKPLVLKDIAAALSLHESTISRVTTNKFVHTPQGVFELKFFFRSGLRTTEGEVSSESVKQKIGSLIAAEDPSGPLSDQDIAEMLQRDGVDIARRTVAKYRELLGILSSSRRKNKI